MRRHPQLLHLCHLRPAAAIAARCWHHHASLSHEPRGHSHCRARPAWPNRHLVGAHRGHPQPQPDRCACVQCGRWWLGRAAGSRPCAGDVACHGWPVLWRKSSRSAPRPWLRGCLQAAPRDPGSGVRCVYRSSYGYTRVYWSQLPAVGAFGRVWWPWRTMRTQKVAFLNYRGSPRFGISRLGVKNWSWVMLGRPVQLAHHASVLYVGVLSLLVPHMSTVWLPFRAHLSFVGQTA